MDLFPNYTKINKNVFFEAGKDSYDERKNKYVLIFPSNVAIKSWVFYS